MPRVRDVVRAIKVRKWLSTMEPKGESMKLETEIGEDEGLGGYWATLRVGARVVAGVGGAPTPGKALEALGVELDRFLVVGGWAAFKLETQNVEGRRRMVEAAESNDDPLPSDTLADLLELAGRSVTIEAVEEWNEAETKAAEVWAARSYLRASDSAVAVPPEPVCVMLATRTIPRSRADRDRLIEAMKELDLPLEEIAEVARS